MASLHEQFDRYVQSLPQINQIMSRKLREVRRVNHKSEDKLVKKWQSYVIGGTAIAVLSVAIVFIGRRKSSDKDADNDFITETQQILDQDTVFVAPEDANRFLVFTRTPPTVTVNVVESKMEESMQEVCSSS